MNKRNYFLLIISLIAQIAYSQCSVEVLGPAFICNDDSSSYELVADGAFSTYSWSPGGETTREIEITAPGTYTVTATDNWGCEAIDSLVVSYAPTIIPNVQAIPTHVCIGNSVYLSASGGGAGGTYSWDNGLGTSQEHSFVVNTSGAETYSVTITDAYSCKAYGSVTVTGVDVPSVAVTPQNTDICKGENVTLSATSSQTNGSLTYTWFPSYGLSTSVGSVVEASPDATTSYTVTVGNELGGKTCSASATANVSVDEYSLSTPIQEKVCKGELANIFATRNGGVPPYSYSWKINGVHDPTKDGLINFFDTIYQTTNYTVTGVDGNGCSDIKSFSVESYPDLNLSYYINRDSVCPGEPVLFNANISGGTGSPYEFILDDEFSNTVVTIYPKETYLYKIYAKDACQEVSDTFSIYVYPVPYIDFESDVKGGCVPAEVQFTPTSIPSDIIASYAWNFGDNDANNFSSLESPTHIYKKKGDYNVNLKVRTIHNCFADTSKENFIHIEGKPNISFKPVPPRASILKPIIFMKNTSANVDSLSYIWNFGDETTSDLPNPEHYFPAEGSYEVELIGTTKYGCSDTLIQTVEITPEIQIFVPTAFSPDGDGINDFFEIKGVGISPENYRLTIWDRNGNQIFLSESITDSWDGMHDGVHAISGVYVYHLEFEDIYGTTHEKNGQIYLIH